MAKEVAPETGAHRAGQRQHVKNLLRDAHGAKGGGDLVQPKGNKTNEVDPACENRSAMAGLRHHQPQTRDCAGRYQEAKREQTAHITGAERV
jgi:hypothetical protein